MIYGIGRNTEDNRPQIFVALSQKDVNLLVREQVLTIDLKSYGIDSHLLFFYKPTDDEARAILEAAQGGKAAPNTVRDTAVLGDAMAAEVVPAPKASDADGEVRP